MDNDPADIKAMLLCGLLGVSVQRESQREPPDDFSVYSMKNRTNQQEPVSCDCWCLCGLQFYLLFSCSFQNVHSVAANLVYRAILAMFVCLITFFFF